VAQQDVHTENKTYFSLLLVGNVEVLAAVIKYDLEKYLGFKKSGTIVKIMHSGKRAPDRLLKLLLLLFFNLRYNKWAKGGV